MKSDSESFAMPLLLEPLAERIGHLEHVTQVLQLQFARLQDMVLSQLDERMQAVEDLLKGHGLNEESQKPSLRQHQPEAHFPQVSSALFAPISAIPSQEEDETGGQRTNSQLHIVVKQQDQPEAMVTVEARMQDRVKDVKSQAYQQLSVWHRFRSLASDDTEVLPPMTDCRLSLVGSKPGQPLEEERRLAEYGLTNEAEVLLLTQAQAQLFSIHVQPLQENRSLHSEEDNQRDQESSQTMLVNLLVAHSSGEVNIEARTSETILAVKTRAHQQLEIWNRFTALSGDEADLAGGGLPSLERCRMYSAGSSDGLHLPRPLEEHSILAECGLQDGSKLFLRAA
eukprot:TRINITY_DN5091_c0_g1_i1.p1 TRINITY_DN5091_c0_g1~~TRINITY_DN5091_c0_g1_i1.p1  ORF type:complete len:340 (+),score=72.27 TRINITY_DN5091_c0_g1_i1:45-1064(+)